MKSAQLNKQNLKAFTPEEDQTWTALFNRLERCRQDLAFHLFTRGISTLGMDSKKIPDMAAINEKLMRETGWSIVPVKGLEMGPSFYSALARKEFPIGNFIRDRKDLGYTPEPDIFHDLYGHVPFLCDKAYADFSQRYGALTAKYLHDEEKLKKLERFYWFTMEFGLIQTEKGARIFGGGILSSFDESFYSLSGKPKVLPFDVQTIIDQDFRIDQIQPVLFLIPSEERLYDSLQELEQRL